MKGFLNLPKKSFIRKNRPKYIICEKIYGTKGIFDELFEEEQDLDVFLCTAEQTVDQSPKIKEDANDSVFGKLLSITIGPFGRKTKREEIEEEIPIDQFLKRAEAELLKIDKKNDYGIRDNLKDQRMFF